MGLFSSILGDMRRAVRDLWRRPMFAFAACLTLAVCVALNTAVGSVVHSIVLEPLPFPGSERLVIVFNSYPKAGFPRAGNTVPEYFERREAVAAFEELALYRKHSRSIGEPGAMQRNLVMSVTPSFFRVLGIAPWLGRTFTEDETAPGNGTKTVLSFGLWQELFGGDPSVLGSELRIEGVGHTVVGIMPEGFEFPGWNARLWLPQVFTDEQKSHQGRFVPNFEMLARLRPGATIAQAKSQLDAWNEALIEQVPADYANLIEEAGGFDTRVVDQHDDLVRVVKPWLFLLWGGALFVLLIGGVSLTNLLLVRSTGRLRELATRYVLGAGHARLLRQLLTEGLVLALVGGGLGILAGVWSLRLVNVFQSFSIPRVGEVGLEPAAAALILLLAIAVMAVSSAVAALAAQRRDLFSVLRAGASTLGRGTLRLRGGLAAAQIAVACILLVGAALMTVSLRNLLTIDPGFNADGVFAGALSLPEERYEKPEDPHRFLDAVLTEIRSLPGVRVAALASQLPFSGVSEETLIHPKGHARQPGDDLVTHRYTAISPEYLRAVEIPLIAGRPFRDQDDESSHPVMIVSEGVAERYWDSVDAALGRRVYVGVEPYLGDEPGADVKWHTVVGVVGEVVQNDLTEPSERGALYVPFQQEDRRFTRLVAKVEGEPLDLTSTLRKRIFALDPEVVLFWVTTLEKSVEASLLNFRIPMQLLTVFAGIALLLAAIGVYGVLAQSVAQRSKEISIRMALGSSIEQIFGWVLRGMLVFVAAGLALGLLGALSLTHLMTSLLYDVRASDPMVFLAVGALIGAVALLAATIPARRATRIDPVKALASE